MAHDGANRHDSKLLAATLDSIPIDRPRPSKKRPQGLCLDRAYEWTVDEVIAERNYTPHIRSRADEIGEKLRTPGWRARRWVVEACHSWLNRNRALLMLASGLIAFRRHATRSSPTTNQGKAL